MRTRKWGLKERSCWFCKKYGTEPGKKTNNKNLLRAQRKTYFHYKFHHFFNSKYSLLIHKL